MSDDIRERPIEELEVSVKTSEWLESLGVKTVGDLLGRPTLTVPHKMVAAELREVFDELGVVYDGEIVAPTKKTASKKATGSVAAITKTIFKWLETEHPSALDHFNEPAPAKAIADAEAALGVTLPADYKEFMAIHNGQSEFAPFVGLGRLLPIEEVAEAKGNILGEEEAIDSENVGKGVRAVDFSPRWIPITSSARGRDFFCIDLDPAEGGKAGQIIEYIVDDEARPLIASSFAELLTQYFDGIQTGEIDLEQSEEIADED